MVVSRHRENDSHWPHFWCNHTLFWQSLSSRSWPRHWASHRSWRSCRGTALLVQSSVGRTRKGSHLHGLHLPRVAPDEQQTNEMWSLLLDPCDRYRTLKGDICAVWHTMNIVTHSNRSKKLGHNFKKKKKNKVSTKKWKYLWIENPPTKTMQELAVGYIRKPMRDKVSLLQL